MRDDACETKINTNDQSKQTMMPHRMEKVDQCATNQNGGKECDLLCGEDVIVEVKLELFVS